MKIKCTHWHRCEKFPLNHSMALSIPSSFFSLQNLASFFMINHHSISTLAAFLFFYMASFPSHHGPRTSPPTFPPIYRSEKCNNSFAYHVTINYDFHYISLRVVERVRGIFYHYVIITVIFICICML